MAEQPSPACSPHSNVVEIVKSVTTTLISLAVVLFVVVNLTLDTAIAQENHTLLWSLLSAVIGIWIPLNPDYQRWFSKRNPIAEETKS